MSEVSTSAPAVSVIVPVRNEAGNIAPLVAEIAAALAGRRFEVIYVNDGSQHHADHERAARSAVERGGVWLESDAS
jgi:cellulose synthase/poly-beta-1,6-N-acetylglucosamine synthase-like glycosyltransferase